MIHEFLPDRTINGGIFHRRIGKDQNGGIHKLARIGRRIGDQIAIEPLANPGVVVIATGIQSDPALSVGSPVSTRPEAWTRLGRIVDVTGALDPLLADYTQDGGNRVHLEVRPATAVAAT